MKTKLLKFATVTLTGAAMLALTSCSSTPQGESKTMVAAQKGVPGGVIVETYKVTATVAAIDAVSRQVTLTMADGAKTTVKAGPEVVNFDQIQVGDQVKATVAEQLVVFVRKNGEPANDGEAAAVALAPVGAKPGVVMANTVEVTAKVEAIDLGRRKATLRFPDGRSQTFKVRPDVDMTKAKLGDEVVIRTTEAVAISVEKP
jgi:translation elongation factor P/translation initiation factor 5A